MLTALTDYLADLFARAASNVHALLLYLPAEARWIFVVWVALLILAKVIDTLDRSAERSSVRAIERQRRAVEHAECVSKAFGHSARPARVRLVDLPADFTGPPGKQWWRCRHCGQGRVFVGTVEQEGREVLDHEARCPHRHAFAVATEPVSLVEPDVRVCTECGAPVDPPVDDLLRGLFEPEPQASGWKPGTPPWGTSPLATDMNDAQARRFRQMISDAIRRQQTK